jgi:hypothetical protein
VENGVVTALGKGNAYIKATMITSGDEGVSPVTATVLLAAGLYENDSDAPVDLTGRSESNQLLKALAYIKENSTAGYEYTIVLSEDISDNSTSGFFIGSGTTSTHTGTADKNKNLTITLQGSGKTVGTITKTAKGALFTLLGGTGDTPHLILGENITLQGLNENTAITSNTSALVVVGATNKPGKLMMKDGSRITGNNTNANGGGVSVVSGEFTMDGGKIDNNKAASNGGGVLVSTNCTFVMNAGSISDNIAGSASTSVAQGGGVHIVGSFTMIGGIICGNKDLTSNAGGGGGGVSMIGVFTLKDGEISGNEANIGGGVNIASNANARFNMEGGVISGNTISGTAGAAVLLLNLGTFTKTGGVIFGSDVGANANTGETGFYVIRIGYASNNFKAYYNDTHDSGTLEYHKTSTSAGSIGSTGTWNIP